MLRVQLLGELTVARDGSAVPLAGTLARLLAYVALRPGPHDREALAAQFWPDCASPTARSNLRTAVWALRKELGPDTVVASRSTVGLAADIVTVDVAEMAALVARGELAAAAALCRGELLPDVADDWAVRARAAHHDRYAALLDTLAERADADGAGAEAVRWSRARCALDPFDEPALCRLLRRLATVGDRGGALAAGREFAARLQAELGVVPGPALRAVLSELRGRGGPAARPEDGSRRLLPMFGRSAELAAVMAAWARARDGSGRVVVVTGEGGIGKTRLVGEVTRRVRGAGARVAVGAGVDVGGEAPLAVWHELVRELVGAVPAPPAHAGWPAELGRLAPDLAVALGRRDVLPPVAAPELERLRVFDAVLRLVEWAASDRPVLLVAEDVHRADRVSLALCAHLGRRLAGLPVLFLVTRRERPERPDADALVADLTGRGVPVSGMTLQPLAAAELAAVVRSVAPLADDDVRRVVAQAEGNPLFAVELARTRAGDDRSRPGGAPPATLRAMVRAAVGVLPTVARELVEVLAVAGRGLSGAEVAALALGDPVAAEMEVLDTELVCHGPAGLGFRHALLAEAARADLRDPQRRHAQVALAVQAAAGPAERHVAAEVARHLQRAGRDDLAGPHWRRAARHARSLGALPESAAFWAEAVRCAPDDPDPRIELAEVHAWLGRREEFEREWGAAVALVPTAARAAAWCRRGNVMRSVLCHPSEGMAAYQRALDLLAPDAPPALHAAILAGLAQLGAVGGDRDHAAALLAQAERVAGTPDQDLAVDLATARLLLSIRLGRFDELEAVAERQAAAVADVQRPDQAFAGLVTAACGLAAGHDLAAALRIADRALALTRDVVVLTLPCLAARAHLLSRLGRHDEALAAAHEQLGLAQRLDSPTFAALAHNDAGLVALAAGQYAQAAELLSVALAGDARISRPASRLARAEALARAGDPAGAAAELRRAALDPVSPGDQPWALVPRMSRVQGLIALVGGDTDRARRRFAEAMAAWSRLHGPNDGEELMANLLDLGRPPVVGLVEPARELDRLRAELAALEAPCPASP